MTDYLYHTLSLVESTLVAKRSPAYRLLAHICGSTRWSKQGGDSNGIKFTRGARRLNFVSVGALQRSRYHTIFGFVHCVAGKQTTYGSTNRASWSLRCFLKSRKQSRVRLTLHPGAVSGLLPRPRQSWLSCSYQGEGTEKANCEGDAGPRLQSTRR